jgi:putative transposase
MHKLCMGYAKYFNKKHERTGVLWQGVHKRILIERDAHFIYIPYYIHLNPLDYTFPEWREGNVRNTNKALEALRSYRWSSHLDYLGEKNFPSIIGRSFLGPMLGTRAAYERAICDIITDPFIAGGAEALE